MNLSHLLKNAPAKLPILEATFGIEREGFRMGADDRIAKTAHPQVLGSRAYHPYIQTDYSDPQLELITPIRTSTRAARRALGAIFEVVSRSMDPQEYIWPLSMPPQILEDEIEIARLDNEFEYQYRVHLADKYGKLLQSISGIHYNFELGPNLTQQLFELSDYTDPIVFRNDLYLKIAQNFLNYRWVLTYLFGASPVAEKGFLSPDLTSPVRSIRNSPLGYVNHEDIQVSFASLENYVSDIEGYVTSGQLSAEKEFYAAVRLRGSKHNRDYLTQGIGYIEFRCFDLDPFDELGISQDTLDITHLFVLALLFMDDLENVDDTLKAAQDLNNRIALGHPLAGLPADAPVGKLLTAMEAVIQHFGLDEFKRLMEAVKTMLARPELTTAGQLYGEIKGLSLAHWGQNMGRQRRDWAWSAPYALKGYETMELSTQLLMFDAIQKGIQLEILDETDQFLKLWHGNHVEYVKNGNMTSRDNYVVPLAMANKVVTKKILAQAGYPVPAGGEFDNKIDALRYYLQVEGQPIVVKPKSTNFGLGISIFQEGASFADYEKALDIAFTEDHAVLVETFVSGTEYRFFVLDGQCRAVLLRVAANVVGDGKSSIRELVGLKNQNPLRGRDHRSPLEIINLGDIELLMLSQQGYSPDQILPEGVKVDLRGNSNISTGGDSIDVTETMDDTYKALAVGIAEAMGAWACGVDLIIPDTKLKASLAQPNCTCIETNFNPSMYMHTYCAEGPGQPLTIHVLAGLFPELDLL